jgi:hypothetical protein
MNHLLKKGQSFSSVIFIFLISFFAEHAMAQEKLSFDKVYTVYLRNSGTITEQGQIKGYFFLYQSDKVDKHTNEYTLQILDENLNKVNSIKFEDSKTLSLLESAYDGTSISFLFKNTESNMLDMKIYTLEGKLKYTYSRPFDRQTEDLMKQYETMHTDEGTNKNVFDVRGLGYVSVLPLREGTQRSYEVDFFSSQSKKQWIYTPMDEEKYAFAEYLGSTDSLVIIEVMKKNKAFSGKVTSHLVGLNFITKKKVFEIEDSKEQYKIVPASVSSLPNGNMLVMGAYYDKEESIVKDYGLGIAIYEISTSGKVISRSFNSWAADFSRFLPTGSNGKIDDIGYLYVHRMIRTPDNNLFVVCEGYKKQASAGGIALSVLARTPSGITKVVVTDLVVMQFDPQYKVTGATIYTKTHNTALGGQVSDYNSQHALAAAIKALGGFDYEFTTGEADNSNFTICYKNSERTSDYKGKTFNSIHYTGTKFTTDKIELKTNASDSRVFPAKPGSVMILEFFKKEKKLEFRLEKLG